MTKVALDQLLQITTPVSRTREASQQGEQFRSHLDRAAEAAAQEKRPAEEKAEVSRGEESESVEVASDQQDHAAADNNESTPTTEAEQTNPTSDEELTDQEAATQDELALSEAARVAELAHATVINVSIEPVATEAPQEAQESQLQQPQQLTTPLATETTSEANSLLIPADAAETEAIPTASAPQEETQSVEKSSAEKPAPHPLPPQHFEDSTEQTDEALSTVFTVASAVPSRGPSVSREPVQKHTAQFEAGEGLPIEPEQEGQLGPRSTEQPSLVSAVDTQSLEVRHSAETDVVSALVKQLPESTTVPEHSAPNNELPASVERLVSPSSAKDLDISTANTTNSTEPETPAIDRVRFVQRVSGAIRSAQQRDGQIQLRLSPPELGTLKIQLTVNEGAITANLETETASARTILLDNLPALRERLSEQGITIEKFDVDVGREGQQQADNRGPDGKENDARQGHKQARAAESTTQEAEVEDSAVPRAMSTAEASLDIRI